MARSARKATAAAASKAAPSPAATPRRGKRTRGEKQEGANHSSILDTPVRNIRVKVKMTSKEIVGVEGNPLSPDSSDVDDVSIHKGSGGEGKSPEAGDSDGGDDSTGSRNAIGDTRLKEDEPNGRDDSEELNDVMMMSLPGSIYGDENPKKEGTSEKGEVAMDHFSGSKKGSSNSAGAGDGQGGGKAQEKDDKPATAATAGADAANRSGLFDYTSDDSPGGGDGDPGDADDSSYDDISGVEEDDALIADEDDMDDDDEENNANRSFSSKNSEALLNAKVRLTTGFFNGMVGTIVGVNHGWYTINEITGRVRLKDFVVLEYADGTKGEGLGGEDTSSSKKATNRSAQNEKSNSANNNTDLVGAKIRIRNGKFIGLTGTVNEKQTYRHVQLDILPVIPPVKLSNIKVLSYENKNAEKEEDLTKRYVGAKVRIISNGLGHEGMAGKEGKVLKVIVGDWYITDNPKITNAYRADKFEVLEYPPGVAVATAATGSDKSASGTTKAISGELEGADKERKEGGLEGRGQEKDAAGGTAKVDANNAAKNEKAKRKNSTERDDGEEDMNDRKVGGRPSAANADSAAASVPAHPLGTPSAPNSSIADATISPPLVASNQDILATAQTRPEEEEDEDNSTTRNFIGATIRIKKGCFTGLTGVIKEKQSIRRLQLNNVTAPLDFDDVTVLEYAPNAIENADDFAQKYQKYVGAKVRVLSPEEYAGMEGRVIRVIVLGDWYITDNPNITMAFPEHKFEVIKWPGEEDEDEDDGSGDGNDDGDGASVHGSGVVKEEDNNGDHKREGKTEEALKIKESDKVKDDGKKMNVEKSKNCEEKKVNGTDDCDADGMECDPEAPINDNEGMVVDEGTTTTIQCGKEAPPYRNASSPKNDKKDSNSVGDSNKKVSSAADNEEIQDERIQNDAKGVEDTKQDLSKNLHENQSNTKEDTGGDLDANNDKEKQQDDEDQNLDNEKDEKLPPDTNPLIGATACICEGSLRGLSGKIIMVEERGWWTLDNPTITKKVGSKNCNLIDDGSVDMEKIMSWYAGRNRGQRIPRVVKPGCLEEEKKTTVERKSRASKKPLDREGLPSKVKCKIAETDFTGDGVAEQRKKLGVVIDDGSRQLMCDVNNAALSNISQMNNSTFRPKTRVDTVPALNPIMVHASDDRDSVGKKKKNHLRMQLLPAGLRQLPADTKVEIFNRRTGKIMRGDNAILLSDLPAALMDHAEYEPVIPPPGNSSITSRIGRSGPNVRINSGVIPQTRVRASRVEGRSVLVTGGEYRGRTGTIDSCVPGGWYLVSNLFKKDKLDVVINSRHLQLIPEKNSFANSASSKGQGADKIRIHLKAAKLRLETFEEERKRLQSEIKTSNGAFVELKKLEIGVKKTNERIADLQKALDRMP